MMAMATTGHAACEPELLSGTFDRADLPIEDMYDYVSDPGPNQRRVVSDAASYFSTALCHGAKRIVFVTDDGESGATMGWVDGDYPDLVMLAATSSKATELNLSQRGVAPQYRAGVADTIVHEATHAAVNLLNHVKPVDERSDTQQLGDWIFDSYTWEADDLAFAEGMVKRNLLDRGLEPEWADLHRRSIEYGLARPYHGKGDAGLSADAIVESGFASDYGGRNAHEDIAELTSGILAARAYSDHNARPENPAADLACQRMRAEPGPGIPDELATLFTKVGFLHSVGFIDDIHYDWCVGNLKIRAPGNGFFTMRNDQQRNAYTGDTRGTIGTDDSGAWVFQMQANGQVGIEGSPRAARIELTLRLAPPDTPRPSFPRGLYVIGGQGNSLNIYYRSEGEEKLGISVSEGVALVSRASTDLVEGSVFVLRQVNWTELMPLPTPPSEPTAITFRKKN